MQLVRVTCPKGSHSGRPAGRPASSFESAVLHSCKLFKPLAVTRRWAWDNRSLPAGRFYEEV